MALTLDTNKAPATITLNTSKVAQGMVINLSKSNPTLKRLAVKVAWMGDDLDISAVSKGRSGKALREVVKVRYNGADQKVPKGLLFYMNLEQAGIKHGGDIRSTGGLEEEQINTSAADLDSNVHSIDYILTSHVDEEDDDPVLFKDVTNMTVQLIDMDTNEVLYETPMDCASIADHSGAKVATVYREGNSWSYKTDLLGIGAKAHGVQNIIDHYYS